MLKRIAGMGGFALATSLMACTSGTGVGQMEAPATANEPAMEEQVEFVWSSNGASPVDGDISAEVPGEGTFQGKYMQITVDTPIEGVGPYFGNYWDGGWPDWDGWGPRGDGLIINYTGRVIAVLQNDAGKTIRCRFQLARPHDGPAGGGVGECKGSSGEMIENVVLRGN